MTRDATALPGTRGDPRVPRVVDALLERLAASSCEVCFIAGLDRAYVGPRSGDPAPNGDESLEALARAHRGMLEHETAGGRLGFSPSVARAGDRRIRGLSPLHAFLRALPGVKGRLLRDGQWADPEGAGTLCAAACP